MMNPIHLTNITPNNERYLLFFTHNPRLCMEFMINKPSYLLSKRNKKKDITLHNIKVYQIKICTSITFVPVGPMTILSLN